MMMTTNKNKLNQLFRVLFLVLFSMTISSCASTNTLYLSDRNFKLLDDRLDSLLWDYEHNKKDHSKIEDIQSDLAILAAEHPHHKNILLANAIVAYELKEKSKAQQFLDRSLSLHSVNPHAAILRSKIAIEDGNLNLAKRILNKQITLVPDQFELYEALASVHFLEKDYEKAMNNMKMAFELGAPKGRIKYHLGLIEEQKGRKQRAKGYYRQALVSEPPFQQAKGRLDALEAEFRNTNWLDVRKNENQ